MAIILPANTLSAGGFSVDNSCRFNDGDSAYMTRAFDATQTSTSTFTISVWVKRGVLGTRQSIFAAYDGSADAGDDLEFETDDTLSYNGSGAGANTTSAKFRDPSAWYHIVVARNSGATGAANQVKIYVNGALQTLGTNAGCNVSQFLRTGLNSRIGASQNGSAYYVDMYMAEFVAIDGQMLTPTSFGEYDEDSPTIWKPKDVSGLTFGTNGFYLDFEDSGDLGDDESGNTNDFTETNLAAADQATDTPTNNFATLNPLSSISNLAYAEGNLQVTGGATTVWKTTFSTIGMNYGTSGKWYCEMKVSTLDSQSGIGVWGEPIPQLVTTNFFPNHHQYGFVYKEDGSVLDDSQTFYTGSSFDSGDILMCALDIDNSKIYFGKNGTWQNSGDPTSGATGTGAVALEDNSGGAYFFLASSYGNDVLQMNFGGCPSFSISSGNSDGNGYGNFEYAVPSGYYALCTKNLAEFG